ncbi:MAG: hypothetical protein WAM69_01370 [Candidatus Sulfotelmatobacter sp.]
MTDTLQLEDAIQLHDAPKLLVEWSSPWQEFVTSIRPAFARSGPRLAGEAPHGLRPYRNLLASLLLEAFLVFVVMVLPRQIADLRPYSAPKLRPYEVLYYSGDELPRTEDLGGAQSGVTGAAGGRQAYHPTQTIHVARGGSLAPKVVDAPNLKLPFSVEAVTNLLAFKPIPGPPPATGLRSSLIAPTLPANVIAPAPIDAIPNQSRGALTLDAVVPPAPNLSPHKSRATPALHAEIVPPAPNLTSEPALVAPALNSRVIAPAPDVSRVRTLAEPSLNTRVIGPAATRITTQDERSVPALTASIIPPAPSSIRRAVSPSRVKVENVAVVPPPVSAPESETSLHAKLTLPPPSVIAPPPSADSTPDLRRLESGGGTRVTSAVVPPPPAPAANSSFVSNIIGKLFGTQQVVPPPPTVPAGTARSPAERSGGELAAKVILPPPSINSGSRPFSSASGRRGSGLAAPREADSVLAPPKSERGSRSSGIVLSSQPGSKVAMPGGGKGSLALSPSGGDQPGVGGSSGGSGIGHGAGSGSGLIGAASGAGKTGTGRGSEPNTRAGISPTPGPGGAGDAGTGSPAVPGVDIRGGSTVVTLPSFGSDNSSNPNLPGRSSVTQQQGPGITIVATSRSGGAFDFYGRLPGDNYSVYFHTSIGMLSMQYAEANPASHSQTGALTDPEVLSTDLPADLPHVRVVIQCKLDASGNLRDLQILDGPAAMTAKIATAMSSWKFRPAMRDGRPVAINAILGFNIDTNDRY